MGGLIAFSGRIFGMVEVQGLDAQGVATVIEIDRDDWACAGEPSERERKLADQPASRITTDSPSSIFATRFPCCAMAAITSSAASFRGTFSGTL